MVRLFPAFLLSCAAMPALADVPNVLVDTAPVHSLVAQVMAGVGTPELLMPPGVSPHDFQFRPSDAARVAGAGFIIWTGPGLTGWLEEPLATLAPDTPKLELLASPGWTPLELREDAAFAAAEEDEHGDEAAGEAEGDHDHDHDHGGNDPHAWLSPAVAQVWIGAIASALTTADPDNAVTYAANAAAAVARIDTVAAGIKASLAPVQGRAFIVPHDAYQYFETAFGMPAFGAITLSDASAPGPARIADLRARVTAGAVTCVLSDPETSAEWSAVLSEGTMARTAIADPDGTVLTPGPDLYGQLLEDVAAALVACLS